MAGVKEDELYVVPTEPGMAGWGVSGVFFRDTLYFDGWLWHIDGGRRLQSTSSGNILDETCCVLGEDRSQTIGMRRQLIVNSGAFTDSWTISNATSERQTITLSLETVPAMIDLFAIRLADRAESVFEIETLTDGSRLIKREASDGVIHQAHMRCDRGLPASLSWTLTLAPRETLGLTLDVDVSASDHSTDSLPTLPSIDSWRTNFGRLVGASPAVDQAIDDLRMLLLRTEHGPYPAAGMPIFVNFFGRDALITAMMVLDWCPGIMRTVLRFLAAHQGTQIDPFREEEPGKILHEIRRGELSRTGRIPFGRYYGSVDSTALFLMAAGAFFAAHDDQRFADELRPAVAAATDWLCDHLDGPSGLATFRASGSGLAVQSWKDSSNSMVDEHGEQARQPLAVAEVQGYAFAALLAAARMLPERADTLTARAAALREAFHAQFWVEEMGTYAMALDADLKPLRVLSSDPGHLLWTGIVPEDIAPTLVATLMSEALWSGWGIRTLGLGEVAYNPVSYHNGSVWPHDTGLFGMGLAKYGFTAELRIVAKAMLDLAAASPGRHMPELISGYPRTDHAAPVPYAHANAPQAWAAAAVLRMASYLEADGGRA